jgi:hypothetical protein
MNILYKMNETFFRQSAVAQLLDKVVLHILFPYTSGRFDKVLDERMWITCSGSIMFKHCG